MLQSHSYKAEVEGNILTWTDGTPPELKGGGKHDVLVIVSPESSEEELARSRKLAEILEKLSKSDPFKDIDDPAEWQRTIREDRSLYGRE